MWEYNMWRPRNGSVEDVTRRDTNRLYDGEIVSGFGPEMDWRLCMSTITVSAELETIMNEIVPTFRWPKTKVTLRRGRATFEVVGLGKPKTLGISWGIRCIYKVTELLNQTV